KIPGDGVYVRGGEAHYRQGRYDQPLFALDSLPLRGQHNRENAVAAAAVGRRLKVCWDPQIQTTSNERVMKLLRQEGDDIPWKPWRKRWAGPLLA
ncbi:MAG: hypothetical protein IIA65_03745, partial [Planctomycetes bacterium]|nr:hypothetical protein [Planctomycetota bacterium]